MPRFRKSATSLPNSHVKKSPVGAASWVLDLSTALHRTGPHQEGVGEGTKPFPPLPRRLCAHGLLGPLGSRRKSRRRRPLMRPRTTLLGVTFASSLHSFGMQTSEFRPRGAAALGGIKRRLGLSLEVGHDVAGDQLEALGGRLRVRLPPERGPLPVPEWATPTTAAATRWRRTMIGTPSRPLMGG